MAALGSHECGRTVGSQWDQWCAADGWLSDFRMDDSARCAAAADRTEGGAHNASASGDDDTPSLTMRACGLLSHRCRCRCDGCADQPTSGPQSDFNFWRSQSPPLPPHRTATAASCLLSSVAITALCMPVSAGPMAPAALPLPLAGDAVLSLLSLKNAAAPTPPKHARSYSPTDSVGEKENWEPNLIGVEIAGKSSLRVPLVMHCSPQKQRLLLGRLQASGSGSAGISSRVGAHPPDHVGQMQLAQAPYSAALQAALDAAQHKSQQQPHHGSVRRPSAYASLAPTLVPKSSPHRRTIRPTPVLDHATSTKPRAQHEVQPIPSPALQDAASTASSSSSVGSADSPPFTVSHAVPMDASALPTLSDFPPLPQEPAHTHTAVAQPQHSASPLTAAAAAAAGTAAAAIAAPMQRSLSAPADTFVSPYRSKPPLSAPPASASASAEYLLAEQLLRTRSSSSSGSQMSGGGPSSNGLFSTATLANSSMQSSCSAVALARSSYTLGALTACPSTSSARHAAPPASARSTCFGSAPPARSASSGTISVPGSKGRCIGAAASCFRLLRSSDPSFPSRLGSFTVQVRPLDQIVQKANSITEGRTTHTYEFP